MRNIFMLSLAFLVLLPGCRTKAQVNENKVSESTNVYTPEELEKLFIIPEVLKGYRPNQKGPLTHIDKNGNEKIDSTFTVEIIKVPSEGFNIHGWLYLPLGEEKVPLIVLTNGGGDDSRPVKSLSEWLAPILAHCGYAAFVHDKRGTGSSEGDYLETTYNTYITDAGNCAKFLSSHKRVDPDKIGIMGGSEGGRVAVIAASRFPEIKFVISQAGTVVSPIDDRLFAHLNWMKDAGLISDSIDEIIRPLWVQSFEAWATRDPEKHRKVNEKIFEMRKKYNRNILPFTKQEMDSIPEFRAVIPTWNSLGSDYMSEMANFDKRWFAIFGAEDRVVPTEASVKNIQKYMSLSGNENYDIAIIPRMGHAPVDIETKRLIRIDNLVVNWLNENIRTNGIKDK